MKRRDFLTSTALFSLFAGEAWAQTKPAAKPSTAKPAAKKPAAKPNTRNTRTVKPTSSSKPKGPVARTAADSVIERPPEGTSASRLPPVRPPEPPTEWRTFEITTTVTLPPNLKQPRLWLPLPMNQDALYQRTLGHAWSGNSDNASMSRLPDGTLEVFFAEWDNSKPARLELTTKVTTADRHFDVTKRTVAPEREDILRRYLQGSQLVPNDGTAHALGERIVGRIKDPVAQAKAIYDWVIDNTVYDPTLPGAGNGDVRRQINERQYGGRSADINGLFVSLCRGIGIPARCVYGLRVAPSRLVRSLGLTGNDATRGQHVRAEFYIPGYGWIAVDPSDVRRAIAMEGLAERDSKLFMLRKVLFGVWEMNWIAYNTGTDISLPGQGPGQRQPFLLLPKLEAQGEKPQTFPYTISARQIDNDFF